MKIVIIGTAYPFRGGIASFNERLAEEFQKQGDFVQIFTFTLQYPNLVFPGKTQYSDSPPPSHLEIQESFSSINPISWWRAGKQIQALEPDLVISKFWLPFMGPCLGTILKLAKQNKHTKVLSIIDNIIPHEKRIGDTRLAQYFVNQVDAFIVMSRSVERDMTKFTKEQPVKYIPHPIYDNYGDPMEKAVARQWLQISEQEKYILFFGFIRDYKGLDLLIRAMADERIRQRKIRLIVAGEYYGNREKYEDLINSLNVEEHLILRTDFIPNEEVKYYFSAADLVVQPYKSATQSGISQLCYHFEKPMVVTNVGGLPEIVKHGKAGYVVEVKVEAIADAILDYYDNGKEQTFVEVVKEVKKEFAWDTMVNGAKEMLFEDQGSATSSPQFATRNT